MAISLVVLGAIQVGSALYSGKRLWDLSHKSQPLSTSEKVEACVHVLGLGLGTAGAFAGTMLSQPVSQSAGPVADIVVGGTIRAGGGVFIQGENILIQRSAQLITPELVLEGNTIIERGAQILTSNITSVGQISAAVGSVATKSVYTVSRMFISLFASQIGCTVLPQAARAVLQESVPTNAHLVDPPDPRLPRVDQNAQSWKDCYLHLPEKYEEEGIEYQTVENPVFENYFFQEFAEAPRQAIRFPVIMPRGEGEKPVYMEYSIALLTVLKNGNNPFTGEEMTIDELKIDIKALDRIEAEMQRVGLLNDV